MTDFERIAVGDVVEVVLLEPRSPKRWLATCPLLPSSWTCEVARRGEQELVAGDRLSVWAVKVDHVSQDLVVSASDFGFVPISDRMRHRYLEALGGVIAGLQPASSSTLVPEQLSEVKGMFTRCTKRDQPDWCAMYVALGRPLMSMAMRYRRGLGEAARALRNDDERVVHLVAELRGPLLLARLHGALEILTQ